MTAEQIAALNAAFLQFKDEHKGEIGKMKTQLDAIETFLSRSQFPGGGNGSRDNATVSEYRSEFLAYLRRGGNEAALKGLQVKAELSTLEDPSGGFMVVPEMESSIDRVLAASSAMRRVANVKTITTGEYKRLISQGGCESGWVTEKQSRDETDTPTLAEIAINAKELFANPKTTQTLLDDASYDVSGWLEDEITTAFSEQEGTAFINGNGVAQPKGINAYDKVANASYTWGKVGYIAGGHATLLNNVDKIFDLYHSLKPVYRQEAVWVMNDNTFNTIRKFKDGEGNYLWRPGLSDGEPATLLGKPVEIDEAVDDIGANKFPLWFGNFKRGYLIADRKGVYVLRDPYSQKPYVFFYTTKRVGGGIIMYEAIKCLKIATS